MSRDFRRTDRETPWLLPPSLQERTGLNFTDAVSRIMPSSEGFVQGFNAQAAVNNGSHLIVGACNGFLP